MNTRKLITLPMWLGILVFLGSLSQGIYGEQQKLNVLVSIEPIALIVRDLVGEHANVQALITGAASPHHYALTPSQLQQLREADLIVWIDPHFEFFMAKMMAQLTSDKTRVMQLSTLSNITWPKQHSDEDTKHDEGKGKYQDHGHDDDHDFHLWLHPANVKVIVKNLHHVLHETPWLKKQEIRMDTDAYLASLDALTAELTARFDHVNDKQYAAFHDAYGHFTEAFNLTQVDFVAQVPDEQISGKRLLNLKYSFKEATCLIADTLEMAEAHKISRLLKLPVVQVDVLAVESNQKYFNYHDYLRNMASNFLTCLTMK